MGGGLGQAFSAEQNDKTLTVVTTNQQLGEVKAVYNLDGSESKNRDQLQRPVGSIGSRR